MQATYAKDEYVRQREDLVMALVERIDSQLWNAGLLLLVTDGKGRLRAVALKFTPVARVKAEDLADVQLAGEPTRCTSCRRPAEGKYAYCSYHRAIHERCRRARGAAHRGPVGPYRKAA